MYLAQQGTCPASPLLRNAAFVNWVVHKIGWKTSNQSKGHLNLYEHQRMIIDSIKLNHFSHPLMKQLWPEVIQCLRSYKVCMWNLHSHNSLLPKAISWPYHVHIVYTWLKPFEARRKKRNDCSTTAVYTDASICDFVGRSRPVCIHSTRWFSSPLVARRDEIEQITGGKNTINNLSDQICHFWNLTAKYIKISLVQFYC